MTSSFTFGNHKNSLAHVRKVAQCSAQLQCKSSILLNVIENIKVPQYLLSKINVKQAVNLGLRECTSCPFSVDRGRRIQNMCTAHVFSMAVALVLHCSA